MKKTPLSRLLCLALILAMLLPAMPALADEIYSDGPVTVYQTPDTSTPLGQMTIDFSASNVNGWYQVPNFTGNSAGGQLGTMAWVPASSVKVKGAEPTPTPTPVVTPAPTLEPGATPTPSPVPGATATPVPAQITGEKDTTYTGVVLQFTVPTGGLWVFDKPGADAKAVESIAAGKTLTLTSVEGAGGWYSLYYNGTTYYVPDSSLKPNDTAAVTGTNVKSVTIVPWGATYYYGYNPKATTEETMLYTPAGTLSPDAVVNVTYVAPGIYSFVSNGRTYYFWANYSVPGSERTSTVVGNESATLMTKITVAGTQGQTLRLYRSTEDDRDFVELSGSDYEIYGQGHDDKWYKVAYKNEYYFVKRTDVANLNVEKVANNDGTAQTATFWVTIRDDGNGYQAEVLKLPDLKNRQIMYTIPPGTNILVAKYNAEWYTHTYETSTDKQTYFINKYWISASTETAKDKLSSFKVWLPRNIGLYDRTDVDAPVTGVILPQVGTDDTAGYYVVTTVDDKWYSIVVSGGTYYVKKSDVMQSNQNLEPIATVTDGKTYSVTLGRTTDLYRDEKCTVSSGISYGAGTVLAATKYSNALYTVDVAGVKYFLPVAAIATVGQGDDTTIPGTIPDGSISDIITGKPDPNYTGEVLSFNVPSTGLWLYYSMDLTRPALSLSAGGTIKLTPVATDSLWYTTWYDGREYYVHRDTMLVSNAGITQNATDFSVRILQDVGLYKNPALSISAGATLKAGDRVNAKAHTWLTDQEKLGLLAQFPGILNPADKLVGIYSTTLPGMAGTLYFRAFQNGAAVADQGSHLSATVGSNANTNLITKLDLNSPNGTIYLYSKMDSNSSRVLVDTPITLYGVLQKEDLKNKWYKVIYDGSPMYIDLFNLGSSGETCTTSEVSVAGDVKTDTFTVVIAAYTALYTQAIANNAYIYSGRSLVPGEVVQATAVAGGWYSIVDAASKQTLFFSQAMAATSNANAAIQSYIITVPAGKTIKTYTTIATNTLNSVLGPSLMAGETHTLRKVNSTWSSVSLEGQTYYLKNADIDDDMLAKSTPVASTTIGKTYTVTLGSLDGTPISLYPDSKLEGAVRATLPGGTVTTGTKMYVQGARSNGSLVYKVTHNGAIGYIDAKYVVGVASGDEVDEAKAAEEAAKEQEAVNPGETITRTLPINTLVYEQMNTSTTPSKLGASTTVTLKKVDASWYSTVLNDKTYYVPATTIEALKESEVNKEGEKYAVGDTFAHTLSKAANAYAAADINSAVVDTILPNILIQLSKVSREWYEMPSAKGTSGKVYLYVDDVFASSSSSNTNKTHDDAGIIITKSLMVKVNEGSTLNLRKAIGSPTIMERIPNGSHIPNNGGERDASGKVWYKTSYKGKSGYVDGTYVEPVGTVSSEGSGNTIDPSKDIGRTLYVDTSSVNVRKGPGTSYDIVGRVAKDDAIVPLSYKTGDDGMVWYEFQHTASVRAYIRYDYLRGGAATNTELSGNVAVKAGGTNLRSGAGESFSPVTRLDRGTIVTITGSATDSNNVLWYRVTLQNLTGYLRFDLVRALTTDESEGLYNEVLASYTELKYGSSGQEVLNLQQQLINLGYLAAGQADGTYGNNTTDAVKRFQKDKGLSQTGIATASVQAAIFNTTIVVSGSTSTLDWFAKGKDLIAVYPNVQVYDINSGVTWNAKYVEGGNHADVVPATAADAQKLKAGNITGSYVRRPVIVTINGVKYAGSMYAVGHGTKNFVSFFSGVMCLHFTGSKTHGSGNVDADHQNAIKDALEYASK